MDNLKLNKISPLLSSTERVKSVDRRRQNKQQPPFEDVLQGRKKKKKKKKRGGDEGRPAKSLAAGDSSKSRSRAPKSRQKEEGALLHNGNKKRIDIRV